MNNNDNGSNKKALYDKKDREKKEIKEGNLITGKEQALRDEFGRWLPGKSPNPKGRPPDKIKINKDAIIETLVEAEEAHKKPFLRHLWDRAYKNDTVALEMLRTFVAKQGIDISKFTGAGQFNVIIQTFSSGKDDKPVNIDITPDQGDAESNE